MGKRREIDPVLTTVGRIYGRKYVEVRLGAPLLGGKGIHLEAPKSHPSMIAAADNESAHHLGGIFATRRPKIDLWPRVPTTTSTGFHDGPKWSSVFAACALTTGSFHQNGWNNSRWMLLEACRFPLANGMLCWKPGPASSKYPGNRILPSTPDSKLLVCSVPPNPTFDASVCTEA